MNTRVVYYSSPIGWWKIEASDRAIIGLSKIEDKKYPLIKTGSDIILRLREQLDEYFLGERKYFDIEISPQGTDFQKRVWQTVKEIPYGETASYKEISLLIDSPKSYRAVGMANNKNPIAIIIPCHRIIGIKGALIGYNAGISIKRELLTLEGQII